MDFPPANNGLDLEFCSKIITSEEFWQAVVRRNNKGEVVYIRKKQASSMRRKLTFICWQGKEKYSRLDMRKRNCQI